MEKKQKAEKKAPAVKPEDKKKELSEKDLDKVSGGTSRPRVKPRA